MIWALVGFVAGFATCWYGTKTILRRVIKNKDAVLTQSVMGSCKYDDLLTFKRVLEAELEKRRWRED